MTDDTVADAARSAAAILAPEVGPNLPAEVEAALYTREHGDQRPGQYDPLALAGLATGAASLIVSIAQLAQAILSDRRTRSAETSPDSIARQVRIRLREREIPVPAGTDRITDVVVTEIIRLSGDHGQPGSGQLPSPAGGRQRTPGKGHAGPPAVSQFVSHSPPSATVHRWPPGSCSGR